ncbi:MAG: hypothetical protein UY21_C0022G0003 [Microgenomates group bacterium GW2011_GWA1_48_10]|uniref:Uncharacterized protein n=1 Tax=Candidatus Gottesmanbacteria bacterium RIFCSPHIGHO2_01_FULL_47_48 TaxID=1798381 RepID=A0A1F6A184_9BACT|nr:MAG: hypothetical protein UY21_C0022G0003 [Microgenomates group bacterium GW2011_GWA1_48_10]OGG18438.1 MAG: hypothetical protein A2721_01470 [Candidatus Gottesmanbacteria bacterium RIFCSPHIGHO2_01_FULL_47_48]
MEQTLTLFSFFQAQLLIKLFLIVLAIFYFIFTLVVYRQVSLLTQTLNSSISPLIRTAALLQILAVAGLLVLVFLLG